MKNIKSKIYAVVGASTAVLSTGVAFATDPPAGSGVAISAAMLKPLIDGVAANIAVILPVGITVFAIILGVSLIPKIIKKFM